MADYLDELNSAQRRAATHGDGPVLVIAGAGTGKTKTLACRVAHLIGRGVAPDRILLLTFTRRAAAEMLSRAARLTDKAHANRVWGGTFHAIANRLLRIYGQAVGLAEQFTVIDQSDAADVMNLLRNELGRTSTQGRSRFPRKTTLVSIYSRMVNSRTRLEKLLDTHYPWCAEQIDGIRQVFEAYTRRKREQNVLDYDDLLLYWLALLNTDRVGDEVADRFDHLLVDEYQDTNLLQAQILQGMRRKHRNIMVVGDDAQSIYSFRAATVRNILDFGEHFPGAATVTLEQNYRSTQPILAASNAVMAHAGQRYTKNLFSDRPSHEKPAIITCLDEAEQCEQVADRVLAKREEGAALREQAVLFRTGHHSDALEVELTRRNIPFVKFGGLKFIEAAHVKDMIAILRILENPADQTSWFRVLQLLQGIGPTTAARAIDALLNGPDHEPEPPVDRSADPPTGPDPLQRFVEHPPKVPSAAQQEFEQLRRAIADCAAMGPRQPAAQVERLRRFYEPVFERIYENPAVRLRDIEQLEQIASGYKTRSGFITDLTLDPPTSTQDLAGPPLLDEDYLILSTIHSAKGCEWDVVHIIHAADGMIPSDMATRSDDEIAEERRLLYVAMTRARHTLWLYFPLRYYFRRHQRGDRHSYAQLTRFIPSDDLPHYQREGTQSIEADARAQITPTDPAAARKSIDHMLGDLMG